MTREPLTLEAPFYLPEIRERYPALRGRTGETDAPLTEDDFRSDAICEALNHALKESIEAALS